MLFGYCEVQVSSLERLLVPLKWGVRPRRFSGIRMSFLPSPATTLFMRGQGHFDSQEDKDQSGGAFDEVLHSEDAFADGVI